MSLRGFSISNYRSFRQETAIELRPLTLLFGINNAGKSALMRVLPLLCEGIKEGKAPIWLSGKIARGARFQDLQCRFSDAPRGFGLALRWDEELPGISRMVLQFNEHALPGRKPILFINELSAYGRDGVELGQILGDEPGLYQARVGGEHHALRLSFRGSTPQAEASHPPLVRAFLKAIADRLGELSAQVRWLEATRRHPKREYSQDTDTDEALPLLAADKQDKGPLLPAVSRWYEDTLRRRLDVVTSADGKFYGTLVPLGSPELGVNIADTGEGMTQVLPVITVLAQAQLGLLGGGVVLALEQPELHLHTDAQAKLAALLCDVARSPSHPCLLIETHSENLLLETELEIARGRLSPQDAVVYWVWQADDGESAIARGTFDEQGRLRGVPPEPFRATMNQARELLSLRMKAGRP